MSASASAAMPPFVILSAIDNIAVATRRLDAGQPLAGGVATIEAVDGGHKIALKPLPKGTPVVKYGQAIGRTTQDVAAGACSRPPTTSAGPSWAIAGRTAGPARAISSAWSHR